MNKLIRAFVFTLLLPLSLITQAQRPQNTFDTYATFSEMRANAPVGGCGCFWMSGGVGGVSVPLWRNFSAVAEAGGNTTGHIPAFNTGLSLFYGMGGLRMRVPNHTKFQPFGQGLFGGVHGFDSYFPAPVGKLPTSYDTSFALTVGGGLDIAISKHVWIRAIQAITSTPNSAMCRKTVRISCVSAQVLSSGAGGSKGSSPSRISTAASPLMLRFIPEGSMVQLEVKKPSLATNTPFSLDDLRNAIGRHEIVPYFQPIVELRSGRLWGFEVLARWQHAKLGFVPPDKFVSVIESSDLIHPFFESILNQAFAAIPPGFPENLTLSVNVSRAAIGGTNLSGGMSNGMLSARQQTADCWPAVCHMTSS